MAFMIYTYSYYCEGIKISELMINKTCGIDQVTINNHTIQVQLVGRLKKKWEDNIQIILKETVCDNARWMEQAEECNHCDRHLSTSLSSPTSPDNSIYCSECQICNLNNFYPGFKFVKDISIRGSYSHFAPVSFTQLELSSLHRVLCGRWRNEALSLLTLR